MAKMAKLIDTSLCQGCKACQVACKQWNKLAPVTITEGLNYGSYQNPPSLSWHTWAMVRFTEVPNEATGKVHWAFNKDSCRHCPEPFCMAYCPVEGAITKDADTGAVVIHSELCGDCCAECVQGCPYDIPRLETELDEDGDIVATYSRAYKCRMCIDRINVESVGVNTASTDMAGITGVGPSVDLDPIPACAKACPAGGISFGTMDEMITRAHQRLAKAWNQYPNANIYPGEGFGCMWILTESPDKLGLPIAASMADATPTTREPSDRRSALASLLKPLGLGALAVGAIALGARGGSDEDSADDSKKG